MKNKICVGLFGSKYHINLLKQQLNNSNDFIYPRILEINLSNFYLKLSQVDIYHGIYAWYNWKQYFLAKLLGKKTICHWIGSDILQVLKNRKSRLKVKLLDGIIDLHLAGSETLVEELRTVGIKAQWMPLVSQIEVVSIPPFPQRFSVLSYVSDTRPEFYGMSFICKLAQEFPDVDFLIVGTKGRELEKKSNVAYLGWQKDMRKIYNRTTVFLRFPQHDGLSLSVLESMAFGRQVIWNNKFPYCHYARTYDEAKKALIKIKNNPTANYEGARYVREEFNTKKIVSNLTAIYMKVTE